MKYKEIFKKWWFYALVLGWFIVMVLKDLQEYKSLYFVEYFGILIGSFISTLVLVSIGWLISRIFKSKKK